MKKICLIAGLVLVPAVASAGFFDSKPEEKTTRAGNIETISVGDSDSDAYKLIYTYDEKNRKVRGEYWEKAPEKKEAKKSNILAGTAVAQKYEAALADAKTQDAANVQLDVEQDGFILKNVRIVRYNDNGTPAMVMSRGYTSYPVVGTFNLKTDYTYTYDSAGRLSSVKEMNINTDAALLNMGIGNTAEITRDASGRPTKVTRVIGSVPPSAETTIYSYNGKTDNMTKTVYRKCSLNMTKLSVDPSETITVTYGGDVPWNGMKKYEFDYGTTIQSVSIYDEAAKKQKLDLSDFTKLSFIEKAQKMKVFYDLYKNEQQGPKWRMGQLPDVPSPFMTYKDYAWWK